MQAANAEYWDREIARWRNLGLPSAQETQILLGQLGRPPGGRILDAGCGGGRSSVALAREGYRVHVLDVSPQSISAAKELAREHGLDDGAVSLQVGDLEAIDFPDGHFAAILCRNVLDFVPAPGRVLTEFWRLLHPGGCLALAVLGAASIVKREDWRRFLPDRPTPALRNQLLPWEAEALLRALGWDIVEQFPSFAASVAGVPNPYTPELAARLQDRLLQQTVASSWWFVATKSTD